MPDTNGNRAARCVLTDRGRDPAACETVVHRTVPFYTASARVGQGPRRGRHRETGPRQPFLPTDVDAGKRYACAHADPFRHIGVALSGASVGDPLRTRHTHNARQPCHADGVSALRVTGPGVSKTALHERAI